jgi:hypothetical protein
MIDYRPEQDWLRLRIRDRVYDIADERHTGRIVGVRWTTEATVRWDETGWLSEVPMTDLRFASRLGRA